MLYWFMKRVFAPIIRSVYRPKVEGLENVPATGQVILASNHLAFVDSIVIPMVMPRRVNFLAKAEYFQGRGIKGALMRGFFGGLGHIPVERGSGRAARAALDTAEQVLNGGGAFAIYPEGTRSLDGRLYRGHAGVARIALATGAPVVPVALIGTDQVQRNGRGLPRIRPITVRFGTPLDFSRYEGMGESTMIHRAVTDEIMYAILELSGQEYVDSYRPHPKAA
ncbi:lysophospholipid acyltransferase family protein [Kutzneria viridogrisea]|uniref:Phospholipid/glycerol acyltransferase domain-containing protein n=2 Tax=Kutzneria TaxID=43356 RepID=W5WKR7_9PSEU|nr:lysophospholipid acyltransferase family protein [Kutzneria albida]AHI01127.1 hypothetical protein KALB_7769 [Kutzneria albida DSM 43870]